MNLVTSALIKREHFFPLKKFPPVHPVLISVTVN